MELSSPVFGHQEPIPTKYTCEGEDLSPPLAIAGVPEGAKSLVLIVEDPDAPRGTFDHWITWNLDPDTRVLAEGESPAHQGRNDFGSVGYRGPCPPPGKPHHYFFKLYALDTTLKLSEGSSKKDVLKAIEGHVLADVEIVGTYQRR